MELIGGMSNELDKNFRLIESIRIFHQGILFFG